MFFLSKCDSFSLTALFSAVWPCATGKWTSHKHCCFLISSPCCKQCKTWQKEKQRQQVVLLDMHTHNHCHTHFHDVTHVALFCWLTYQDTQLQVVFVHWFCVFVTYTLSFALFTCAETESGCLCTNLCNWRKSKMSETLEALSDNSLNIFKAVNNTIVLMNCHSDDYMIECVCSCMLQKALAATINCFQVSL